MSLLTEMFKLQTTEDWLTDDHVLGVIMDLINTCKTRVLCVLLTNAKVIG